MKRTVAIAIILAGLMVPALADTLHPIINANDQVFGATKNGRWIDGGITAKHLKGGEVYSFYSVSSRLGSSAGTKPTAGDEPCPDVPVINVPHMPQNTVIGIAAPWNALPRQPRFESTNQPVYQKVVSDYLKSRGIRHPHVQLTQVARCDIDGHGTASVIIAAKYDCPQLFDGGTASFYVVLVRSIVDGRVRTIPLLGDVALKPDLLRFPTNSSIRGLYDLTGNGKMEILIDAKYQDSAMSYIFSIKNGRATPVLTTGCSV
jgi:hypothetical protein